jgi:hypothetical protein
MEEFSFRLIRCRLFRHLLAGLASEPKVREKEAGSLPFPSFPVPARPCEAGGRRKGETEREGKEGKGSAKQENPFPFPPKGQGGVRSKKTPFPFGAGGLLTSSPAPKGRRAGCEARKGKGGREQGEEGDKGRKTFRFLI